MSVLDQIAYLQQRREVPNQELTRKLVAARDRKGVGESDSGKRPA